MSGSHDEPHASHVQLKKRLQCPKGLHHVVLAMLCISNLMSSVGHFTLYGLPPKCPKLRLCCASIDHCFIGHFSRTPSFCSIDVLVPSCPRSNPLQCLMICLLVYNQMVKARQSHFLLLPHQLKDNGKTCLKLRDHCFLYLPCRLVHACLMANMGSL